MNTTIIWPDNISQCVELLKNFLPQFELRDLQLADVTEASCRGGFQTHPRENTNSTNIDTNGSVPAMPCIVNQIAPNRYELVDGSKRFAQTKKSGSTEISALVISPALPPHVATLLRIKINSQRTLTVGEKVRFCDFFWTRCDHDTACRLIGTIAGVPIPEATALKLVPDAPDHARNALLSGVIFWQNFEAFLSLDHSSQLAFLKIFGELKLSLQTQREFIDWSAEMASAQNRSVTDILSSQEIQAILSDTKTNDPQKIKKIHDFLFKSRFPTLSKALDDWNHIAARVNPGPGAVRFAHDPVFEKNQLDIHISVKKAEQAQEILTKLAQIEVTDLRRLIYPVE